MKELKYVVIVAPFDPVMKEDLDFAWKKKEELNADGVYVVPFERFLHRVNTSDSEIFLANTVAIQDYVNTILKQSSIICLTDQYSGYDMLYQMLGQTVHSNKHAGYNTSFHVYLDDGRSETLARDGLTDGETIFFEGFFDRKKSKTLMPTSKLVLKNMSLKEN